MYKQTINCKCNYYHLLRPNICLQLDGQTDTTVLIPVISPEAEGGQIRLNVVTIIWSLKNYTVTKKGFVGEEIFHRKHALAYLQPQFSDMWRSRGLNLYHSFKKCGMEPSFGRLEHYIIKTHLEFPCPLCCATHADCIVTALAYRNDADFKAVDGFIARIPQDTLADASFNCRTYTRGLMHFEQFISTSGEDLQCHLDFLQRLYDCLNEPDGVLGVAAVRKSHSTLAQEILVHESLGTIVASLSVCCILSAGIIFGGCNLCCEEVFLSIFSFFR